MKIKELLPSLKLNGRTVYDEEKQALFFNWTCSGFSFGLKGKEIKVKTWYTKCTTTSCRLAMYRTSNR